MANTTLHKISIVVTLTALYFATFSSHAESEKPIDELSNRQVNEPLIKSTPIDIYPDDSDDSDEQRDIEIIDDIEKPFFSFLDTPHHSVINQLESLVRTIDDFFSSDQQFYNSSGSYLSLRQSIVFLEHGEYSTPSNVRLKLRLPNTEKNFRLFFETRAVNEPDDISNQVKTTPVTEAGESNYVLGIQADSGEGFGWEYKPTLGINIENSFEPFARFRFTRDHKFRKWTLSWHEIPNWYQSLGWGLDSYLELNRQINGNILFRSATFAAWKYETDNADLSHVFSLSQVLDKKKALSYYIGTYGISNPIIHTTSHLIGIAFRQNVHNDYLFFEIEPQIKYQKINNFRPEHSISFRLEMLFKK